MKATWTTAQLIIVAAALEAVEAGADELLRKANETVPQDTAMMLHSGQVDINPAKLTATVSYSGPYVHRQHEDTTLRHPDPRNPNSNPNGRARWLELAAQENKERISAHIRARFHQVLGGF